MVQAVQMPQLLPDTLKAAASGSGGGATSKSDWHRGLEGIICADHIQLDAEVGTCKNHHIICHDSFFAHVHI